MKQGSNFVSVVLFFLLTALPGAQMIFGFAKVEALHGVEENVSIAPPRLTPESFFSEHFQQGMEKWWDDNIGFRGQLVRSDNQLNFDLFREISASYASPLIVGHRNSLFEKLYIEHENGKGYVSTKRLKNLVRRLSRLQSLLSFRGIDFLLLITPSKANVYAEDLPKRYLNGATDQLESNYERFLPLASAAGVNVLDGKALLQKWKSESMIPVFPKGGTHWTQLTACRVSAELAAKLSTLSGISLVTPPCAPLEEKVIPEPFDRDLADLANLWDPSPFYEKLLYPVLPERSQPRDGPRPRMLFVGGSFLWNLFVYLDGYQVYSTRDMFYYYQRRFEFPSEKVSQIDRNKLDWENDILNNRFIVLEVNEITFDKLGSGFVEDAVSVLKHDLNAEPQEGPHDQKASAKPPSPVPPHVQP